MPARSCPSCHSIGTPRLVIDRDMGAWPCVDPWHQPADTTTGGPR